MLAIINVVLYTVGRSVYARERHAIGIQLRLSNRHETIRFTKARVFVVTQSTFHSDDSIVSFRKIRWFSRTCIENVCNIPKQTYKIEDYKFTKFTHK